jgi:hypothetical protein
LSGETTFIQPEQELPAPAKISSLDARSSTSPLRAHELMAVQVPTLSLTFDPKLPAFGTVAMIIGQDPIACALLEGFSELRHLTR